MDFISKLLTDYPEALPYGLVLALLGSLITIFLNRFFDLFHTRKEQRYKLQAKFFEKKLDAAEAAVIQWSNIANAYTSLSILYQRMKENKNFNPNVFENLNQKFDQQMQTALESSELIASSILLYFDVEDELLHDDEPIINLIESLSKIQNLVDQNKDIEDNFEYANDPEFIQSLEDEQEHLREEARLTLENLSGIFDKARRQMFMLIKQIREEMKDYDD